jgi:DNA methyltransferase 1-associated protein 1
MEDMKERYYSVNIKLIKARAHSYYNNNSSNHSTYASPAEARQSLIQQYTFDKAQEVERKKALIGLYQRTKEQIQEEEILFLETKRMEHNREHLTTQRDQLYSTLHLEQAQQVPSTPLTPLASSSSASSYMSQAPLSASSTSSSTSSSHLPSAASGANPGGIGITGGTSGVTQDLKVSQSPLRQTYLSPHCFFPPPLDRKRKRKKS